MDAQGPDLPRRGQVTELDRARHQMRLSRHELWARYFALGGGARPGELNVFLDGRLTLDRHEYDVVVQAVNERSMQLGSTCRWPYSEDE